MTKHTVTRMPRWKTLWKQQQQKTRKNILKKQ